MRTLDEVIEGLGSHYYNTFKKYIPDALAYLKEYRATQMAYVTAIADLEDNPALSWSELKGMVGKPVWFEGYTGEFWCIIREVQRNMDGTEDIILDGPSGMTGIGHDDGYGTGWKVYQKERKQ